MNRKYISTGFIYLGLALVAFGLMAILFLWFENSKCADIDINSNRYKLTVDTPEYYKHYLETTVLRK